MDEHRIITTIGDKVLEFQGHTTNQLRAFMQVSFVDGFTRHLRHIGVTDPRVIVDVGANIGTRSVLYALRWPNCKILAIEPIPENIELLKYNTQCFPNIEIVPFAVSSVSGFATMEMPTAEQLYEHTNIDEREDFAIMSIHGKSGKNRQQVELKTLDEIIGDDPVDFIKIDAEAHEYYVLKGAHNLLTNQRPSMEIEIMKPNQAMSGHTVTDIPLLMAQYRYALIMSSENEGYFMAAP
jgi:FkbM family methyltransferase